MRRLIDLWDDQPEEYRRRDGIAVTSAFVALLVIATIIGSLAAGGAP